MNNLKKKLFLIKLFFFAEIHVELNYILINKSFQTLIWLPSTISQKHFLQIADNTESINAGKTFCHFQLSRVNNNKIQVKNQLIFIIKNAFASSTRCKVSQARNFTAIWY